MKQFGLACLFMISANLLWATVHRVNNVDGVDAPFRTAQAAHNAAAVGDTLYFEHSSAHYGDLLMSKRLTLLGTGNFLSYNPGKQYNAEAAFLHNLVIRPTATGSLISINAYSIIDSANSVTISRASVVNGVLRLVGASNCIIRHSFIAFSINIEAIRIAANASNNNTCSIIPAQNNVIHNNIIGGSILQQFLRDWAPQWCNTQQYTGWVNPISTIAYNNHLQGNSSLAGNFYNNIMFGTLSTDATTPVNNNIFISASSSNTRTSFLSTGNQSTTTDTLKSGNGNQFSINELSIVLCAVGSPPRDTCFQLKPNSPALGAGIGGTNIGPSGGTSPYRYAMLPSIPAITSFSTANSSPAGNSINIKVSTTSNN